MATVFTVIFFGGAALTAFAGDEVQQLTSDASAPAASASSDPAPESVPASAPAPADQYAAPEAPAEEPPAADAPTPAPESAPAPAPAPADQYAAPEASAEEPPAVEAPTPAPESAAPAPASSAPVGCACASVHKRVTHKRVVKHVAKRKVTKATHAPSVVTDTSSGSALPEQYASVTWLSGHLPTLTPSSVRMQRSLVHRLVGDAQAAHVEWSLLFGVLQARTDKPLTKQTTASAGSVAQQLAQLQAEGKDAWGAAATILGDTAKADRAVALSHYNRAVGTETLVRGLAASKNRLVRKVLKDPRVELYSPGRADLDARVVDVRVVAVIGYLADTFGSVQITSLVSGHRLYARPGVVSAHVYGEAVDVAALGGVPIEGHQEPGGVTEQAIRALLFLPASIEPAQIISLLGLGGPSFPLADHYNHIHIGYTWLPASSR
jgi:hypothetical protein